MARSIKDSENANARPSRLTSRSKLGAATTATSARATGSTAASKAKSIASDSTKEEAGVKRKREVLVEVTGLVTNNKTKSTDVKGKDGGKLKEAIAKPKAIATSTRRFIGGAALRRIPRATSESTTVSKTDTDATTDSKPSVDHASEKMEIDQVLPSTKEEDEESQRVFKRRHTEEKPVIAAEVLDDSQAEADKVAAQLEVEPSSSNAQLWDDLDEEDFDDPVMVSEYVVDVCVYLKEIEVRVLRPSIAARSLFSLRSWPQCPTQITWKTRTRLPGKIEELSLTGSSKSMLNSASCQSPSSLPSTLSTDSLAHGPFPSRNFSSSALRASSLQPSSKKRTHPLSRRSRTSRINNTTRTRSAEPNDTFSGSLSGTFAPPAQ